jgi:hypothetical protein
MVSEPSWPSDHEFESHNLYLFDEKIKYKIISTCASFKLKEFSRKDILENNINNVLKSYLTT